MARYGEICGYAEIWGDIVRTLPSSSQLHSVPCARVRVRVRVQVRARVRVRVRVRARVRVWVRST